METHGSSTNWMHPHIQCVLSRIHGRGLRAIALIRAGEPVLIWRAGYTDRAGAMRMRDQGVATMQWDADVYSYATDDDDDAFQINHSCDPNTWMLDAHTLSARRDIQAGEEVTADYALWSCDEGYRAAWRCQCGSRLCRGQVTGSDWRDTRLQRAYAGHFSPLLNRRIADLAQ